MEALLRDCLGLLFLILLLKDPSLLSQLIVFSLNVVRSAFLWAGCSSLSSASSSVFFP